MEAFKLSPRDRVQQRLEEQISLIFQFRVVEVFTDLVLLLHPRISLGAVDETFTWFFALFPNINKVRGWVRTRGRTGCGL